MDLKNKVFHALLALQRHSWEHGVTVQACMELGEMDWLKKLVKSAVYRIGGDGRVALMGKDGSAVDTCATGEGLVYMANTTGEAVYKEALDKLLEWALTKAPRNSDGVVYHVLHAPEFWSDSVHMLPPFLAAAGYYKESLATIKGYMDALQDPETGVCRHIWNDDEKRFRDADLWGVGNGWILAGNARVIDMLPEDMADEKKALIERNKELLDNVLKYRTEDGFYHNIVDDKDTFIEVNLSQMVAYTIYRGIVSGWLTEDYKKEADILRNAARSCVDEDGFVYPVCGMPDFRNAGVAPEGQAYFVLMEAAYERMIRMQKSRLFTILPEKWVCTPDGMEIDKNGDLILSCPNYADDNMSGCVLRITKDKKITKWFDVPVHPETGIARNMGIAFDKDYNMFICDNQGWSGKEELQWKGRILKVEFDENRNVKNTYVVATGMEHPNGIRVYGDYMYVTQSYLTKVKHESGKLVSCVYRFPLDAKDIQITNTMEDKYILETFVTYNPNCQYGMDGIEIDSKGNMYVGNFGDGEVWKLVLDENGDVVSKELYAKNELELVSTDGMIMDEETGNLYIADFNRNAIVMVDKNRNVRKIAESPDCDGLGGELDQPGEPIIWNGKLVVSCFDLVTDETKVNTAHEMPATMAELDLEK